MIIRCKAWDLMGEHYVKTQTTHLIRLVGGRTLYSDPYNTKTDNICLRRVDADMRVFRRYIRWNTQVELVPIPEKTS